MKLHALACALLGCGLVAATACAPNTAKVCENVISIMDELGAEMSEEECLEEIENSRDECEGDFNAAMRCMQGATDVAAMMECGEICEGDAEVEEAE